MPSFVEKDGTAIYRTGGGRVLFTAGSLVLECGFCERPLTGGKLLDHFVEHNRDVGVQFLFANTFLF